MGIRIALGPNVFGAGTVLIQFNAQFKLFIKDTPIPKTQFRYQDLNCHLRLLEHPENVSLAIFES